MLQLDGIIAKQEPLPLIIPTPPPQPQPLLSKNEYIALELTKIRYANDNSAYIATIHDTYQFVLERLNEKEKEKDE